MTISQLVYVNNIYLIPKLCYILQVSNLSKIALQKIQQPYLQLIKNKIGMARTAGNYIISHRGMMGCKLLEQELCIKQISSLQNRLNNDGTVLKLAHIRIKQGLLNAGLVAMEWKSKKDKELQHFWKGNLACRVLVKAEELRVSFGFDENW